MSTHIYYIGHANKRRWPVIGYTSSLFENGECISAWWLTGRPATRLMVSSSISSVMLTPELVAFKRELNERQVLLGEYGDVYVQGHPSNVEP